MIDRDSVGEQQIESFGFVLHERLLLFQQRPIWLVLFVLLAQLSLPESLLSTQSGLLRILDASECRVYFGGLTLKLWNFMWLSGSWNEDRKAIGKTLEVVGERAVHQKKPLTLLVFPEDANPDEFKVCPSPSFYLLSN